MSYRQRILSNPLDIMLALLVTSLLSYQVLNIWITLQPATSFYYAHVGLTLSICALGVLTDNRAGPWTAPRIWRTTLVSAALIAAGASTIYLNIHAPALELRQPFIDELDFVIGGALLAAILILSWYVWGKVLTAVMILAIVYYGFGTHLPWPFLHQSPEPEIVMSDLAGLGGSRGLMWGIPLSANVIFLIIVYGGVLKGLRILDMFTEIGKGIMNVTRGGVCYSSILASSSIGMVTGEPVSNVTLSGRITIPAMKAQGLSAETSAALVTLACLGSQFMPPIMGLAGFLIAVNLGQPYLVVAAAAIIPAALYMLSVVIATYFVVQSSTTLKEGRGDPDWSAVCWIMPSFLLSFTLLIYLLYHRYSPEYAAFWALSIVITTSFLRPARYLPRFSEIFEGLRFGVFSAAQIALVLAGIGLVVQVLVTTGAGFDLGRYAMHAAGDSMALLLMFAMLLSVFVGLGLPTPAAYALIAIIAIPFLEQAGVPPLSAHFFGFYFAVFSAITPPVAVACLTAARIADAGFYRTVYEAGKITAVTLLIPFSFVVFPSLLGFPEITLNMLIVCATLLTSTVLWGAFLYGWFGRPLGQAERLFMVLGPAAYVGMLATGDLRLGVIPLMLLACMGVYVRFAPAGDRPKLYKGATEPRSSYPCSPAAGHEAGGGAPSGAFASSAVEKDR